MNFDDVQKIRETQRSLAKRFDENKQLINEQIVELLGTENAKNLDIARLTEIESIIFKLKAELIDYIEEHGLVDGLIWNGVLQPVQGSKIVITKDMIQAITDSIYNKELAKLAGIEEGAEANKVIDVIFNDVSVLDNDTRVATITITPEDIKRWYESNENTNCYTDAEKELVAKIPQLEEDIDDMDAEQQRQNARLDELEMSQSEQDEKLKDIEEEQATQNLRLTDIEAEQITQNSRLDNIETEQITQNNKIELNETNIQKEMQARSEADTAINLRIDELNTDITEEIEDRKHADEDIKTVYDAEIKRIDQVNEHLQHEVDQKVKDVLLDGISVCDENRNAQLKSNDISKILDVKVDGESVVNSDKVAEIDTSDICKVKDVEVDGKTVVENHIAKIDTTDFCKVKDVTVDGETVVNPDTKVAEIDLSDTKIDTATQINIDGSTSDILSVDSEGNRNITVNASELGVLEDVTLDGESTIRYSNASGGRTAVINSKVKDVTVDGKSIVDSDKVANIDTTNFGKVDDVKIDGESVVVDKVANIDLKPYENDITDVQLDGVSIVKDKIANLSTTSFGEIKDVTVDGASIVDKDTKVANIDTTNLGGVNLAHLKERVDGNEVNIAINSKNIITNTSDISSIKTEQTAQNTNIEKNANDIAGLSANYEELAVDVNNNTNDIASNTTRIASLEQLQSVVPSSKAEADIVIVTFLSDNAVTGLTDVPVAYGAKSTSGILTDITKATTITRVFDRMKFAAGDRLVATGRRNNVFSCTQVGGLSIAVNSLYVDSVKYGEFWTTSTRLYIYWNDDGLCLLNFCTSHNQPSNYGNFAIFVQPRNSSSGSSWEKDLSFKFEYYKFLPASTTTANSLSSDGIALANETEEVNNVEYITIPAVPDGFYEEYKKNLLESGMTEEEANAEVEAQKERQAKAEEEARARQTENI